MSAKKYSAINFAPSLMTSQEKEDYFKFFTTSSGADMLPYAYMGASDNYDDLVKRCDDYYLSKEEIEIFASNYDVLAKCLEGVTDIVEIGPGSEYPVRHKTLPIIKATKNLLRYHGLDHSRTYLEDALNFLGKTTQNISLCSIEMDIMKCLNLNTSMMGKKCILFLGSTLGSFTNKEQQNMMNWMKNVTEVGDMLIISADTNTNNESVLKAYDNEYDRKFISTIIKYFSQKSPAYSSLINYFDTRFRWLANENCVEGYFIANTDFSFDFEDYGRVTIHKWQELRGARSRKFNMLYLQNMIVQNKFKLLEILRSSGSMVTLVCERDR